MRVWLLLPQQHGSENRVPIWCDLRHWLRRTPMRFRHVLQRDGQPMRALSRGHERPIGRINRLCDLLGR